MSIKKFDRLNNFFLKLTCNIEWNNLKVNKK